MGDETASGAAQGAANRLVDEAQALANAAVDVGEEAAAQVLAAVIQANKTIGEALEALAAKLV